MIGIDYGVRRVSIACAEQGWADAFSVPETNRGEELAVMAAWAQLTLMGYHVDERWPIFIESAITGASGNAQTAAGMAETCGALLACFPGRAYKVAPSSWKALVCGHGGLDKKGVAAWLEREHPSFAEACRKPNGKLDQDRVDAACLSLCTLDGLAARRPVPRSRARPVLRGRSKAADQPG